MNYHDISLLLNKSKVPPDPDLPIDMSALNRNGLTFSGCFSRSEDAPLHRAFTRDECQALILIQGIEIKSVQALQQIGI